MTRRCELVGFVLMSVAALATDMAVWGALPDDGGARQATDLEGDALPQGAALRLGTARLRHNAQLWGVVFSADGKMLATSAWDEAVRVWDVATGKALHYLPNPRREETFSLAFSPDGKMLAAGGTGTVRVWNVRAGLPLSESRGHKGRVVAVAFAPDGLTFASASESVQVWRSADGTLLAELERVPRPGNTAQGLAFSPDGMLLAAGRGQNIHVWDAGTWAVRRVIPKAQLRPDYTLGFLDNQTLISSEWGLTRLWDVNTGKQLREINGKGAHSGGAWSRTGKRLALAHLDRIEISDLETGAQIQVLSDYFNAQGPTTNRYAFSPDEKVLAAAGPDHAVRLWDIATGKRLLPVADAHTGRIRSAAFSPDGQQVLTGGNEGSVRLWDAATGRHVRVYDVARKENGTRAGEVVAAMSPDGKLIAAGGYEDSPQGRFVGSCRVWDTATHQSLYVQELPHRVTQLTFSRDSRSVAAAIWNTDDFETLSIHVWDARTGKGLVKLADRPRSLHGLAFFEDGKTLASIEPKGVHVWDVATQKQRAEFAFPVSASAAAMTPDRTKLALSDERDGISIWDVATRQTLRAIKVANTFGSNVALSADGRMLASCQRPITRTTQELDFSIHVWEALTGGEILRFDPSPGCVGTLAFSPDGRTLVTGLNDSTTLLWPVKDVRARPLAAADLERHWTDLAGANAARAHAAACALTAAPGASVPFLKERLLSVAVVDVARVRALVGELGHEQFPIREAASRQLAELGDKAAFALRQALTQKQPLEMHRRVEALLAAARDIKPGEHLQRLRALQVLEDIASGAARAVLDLDARRHGTTSRD